MLLNSIDIKFKWDTNYVCCRENWVIECVRCIWCIWNPLLSAFLRKTIHSNSEQNEIMPQLHCNLNVLTNWQPRVGNECEKCIWVIYSQSGFAIKIGTIIIAIIWKYLSFVFFVCAYHTNYRTTNGTNVIICSTKLR